jgi:hypothetical protein
MMLPRCDRSSSLGKKGHPPLRPAPQTQLRFDHMHILQLQSFSHAWPGQTVPLLSRVLTCCTGTADCVPGIAATASSWFQSTLLARSTIAHTHTHITRSQVPTPSHAWRVCASACGADACAAPGKTAVPIAAPCSAMRRSIASAAKCWLGQLLRSCSSTNSADRKPPRPVAAQPTSSQNRMPQQYADVVDAV